MRPTPPNTLTRRAALISAACALLATSTLLAQPLAPAPTAPTPAVEAPVVRLETSLGNITVRLDPERAPISVANFLSYVDSGFYSGTIFHRVISNFMIQGGGFTPEMTQKEPQRSIPLEVGKGLSNMEGTIAMARTSDPNSATSQFFINVKHNRQLDTLGGGYAVFGQVIEGMDVVNKIRYVPTGRKGMHGDVPTEPVIIKSATRVK
jgi:peptidyl-prolyl cis-trans isomerase A (cyclophilin A)